VAAIVVLGGGMIGLSTAMLLAHDGHDVTVLERDPDVPPEDPEEAWEAWARRGVNQFRLLHFFLPRFRMVCDDELPELVRALVAAGALCRNPMAEAPEAVTGGMQPGDEEFVAVTGRRPVVESVTARVATATPGVTIRRGVAVAGLLTGAEAVPGATHVTGVVTEDGEELRADLVVDATGRRSAMPRWLEAAGGRPPEEHKDDCGFVYFGRHFRSGDGSVPPFLGPGLQHYDSISILTLPADNGTWGIGVVTSAGDRPLRVLRDFDAFTAAVRSYPLAAHWLEGEPMGDEVAVMAGIEDRVRSFTVDGAPVVTGAVAVGDAWACTNPSVGRGASIGLLHAVALRDVLRSTGLDDPAGLAAAWEQATATTVAPWVDSTLWFDRHRLAEIDAQIAGEPYEPGDPLWEFTQALGVASFQDPDLLRSTIRVASMVTSITDEYGRDDVRERALALGAGWRDAPSMGPSRAGLLATLGA
jgi:2-polyprenyl-6-methoxyphenol hydroxylase-like FAD-dependent oxidoreductase